MGSQLSTVVDVDGRLTLEEIVELQKSAFSSRVNIMEDTDSFIPPSQSSLEDHLRFISDDGIDYTTAISIIHDGSVDLEDYLKKRMFFLFYRSIIENTKDLCEKFNYVFVFKKSSLNLGGTHLIYSIGKKLADYIKHISELADDIYEDINSTKVFFSNSSRRDINEMLSHDLPDVAKITVEENSDRYLNMAGSEFVVKNALVYRRNVFDNIFLDGVRLGYKKIASEFKSLVMDFDYFAGNNSSIKTELTDYFSNILKDAIDFAKRMSLVSYDTAVFSKGDLKSSYYERGYTVLEQELFEDVRERHGTIYSISSDITFTHDFRNFTHLNSGLNLQFFRFRAKDGIYRLAYLKKQ